MIKVYVIAPDKASGYAFCDVMKSNGIEAEFNYHKIRPRVIENKITTSKDVINDLNDIFKNFNDKTKSVVIACNTLQLWLNKINKVYKRNVKIYTTFEAIKWKYKRFKNKPLWLGTTPLVKKTKDFPTLISLGKSEVQDLVQELIWRIKMYEGDEYATAPDIVKRDADNKEIQKIKIVKIKNEIIECLRNFKIKNVITGCTELPMIFNETKIDGINFIDPALVLAEYIKSQSVAVIFAGGTISSLANNEGTRVSGKVFDLLEKLNENAPGSYKNLNVTKSNIIYSGFSENMNRKNHQDVLNIVKSTMKNGISRIVITHGTDSMEQTARFLYKKLKNKLTKDKTIVALTGSNDHTGNANSDAWDNLRTAINEGTKLIKHSGVYIAFNRKFVPADKAIKKYYDGNRMIYLPKDSFEYKQSLKQFTKKVININNSLDKVITGKIEPFSVFEYDVNIIRANHNKFINIINKLKPKAIVFKLYHSGTANTTDSKASVAKLVNKLTKRNIICFGATETGEPTDLHLYESSVELLKSGMIPLYNMLHSVAVHKLQLLRVKENNLTRSEVIDKMMKNLVGEIDENQIRKDDIKRLQLM